MSPMCPLDAQYWYLPGAEVGRFADRILEDDTVGRRDESDTRLRMHPGQAGQGPLQSAVEVPYLADEGSHNRRNDCIETHVGVVRDVR